MRYIYNKTICRDFPHLFNTIWNALNVVKVFPTDKLINYCHDCVYSLW